ncbi:hypothetical protein COLO4_14432 [Corchorus olitorius]|uniref:Uncharacterized protein n=1 Tax=Corchorus olitorius TaxID=93759 RepID=A0A1R3JS71_9ROSI|nr:hypothetical protein COLO4_14432 [Corchorus olitorius]
MEAQSSSSSLKKPGRSTSRRRSHTRRSIAQASVINLAEARREIAHALLLHRFSLISSSNPPPISTTTSVAVAPCPSWMLGNPYTYTINPINPNLACSCYSVVEDMPLHVPEPVWSTTAPSLPAAPPPLEALEFLQSGESQAAASTWWFAFLDALDGNIQTTNSHFVDHNSSEQQRHIPKMGDPTNAPDQNNASLDEWLVHLIKQEDDI